MSAPVSVPQQQQQQQPQQQQRCITLVLAAMAAAVVVSAATCTTTTTAITTMSGGRPRPSRRHWPRRALSRQVGLLPSSLSFNTVLIGVVAAAVDLHARAPNKADI
jgi:hypothetical protein